MCWEELFYRWKDMILTVNMMQVGTDPKEARYWLRQFQRSSEPCHPFAVIYVDEDLLEDREMVAYISVKRG